MALTPSCCQFKQRLLRNVIVQKGSAVLINTLSGETEALSLWADALLVLYLVLNFLNRVRGLDIKGDGLACKSLNEDLHLVRSRFN